MKTTRHFALVLALLLLSTQMRSCNNNRSGLHTQTCPNARITPEQADNENDDEMDQSLLTEYRIGNLMSII